MLRFLYLRKANNKSNQRSIIFREKKNKYTNKQKESYISKKKHILITGLHGSGKSKELNKLYKKAKQVYVKFDNFIFLKGSESVSEWLKKVGKKDIAKINEKLNEDELIALENMDNNYYVKSFYLIELAKQSVVFIDDIDNLRSGKKLELMKDIARNAKLIVATAKSETEVNKTIMNTIYKRGGYTGINLSTQQSYDATNILFMVFIIGLFITANYDLAMLVMAGRYALKGMEKK
jgi:nucleoside-triphosphatase THEP1